MVRQWMVYDFIHSFNVQHFVITTNISAVDRRKTANKN